MQFRLRISRAEMIEFARRRFAWSQPLHCQGSSLYSLAAPCKIQSIELRLSSAQTVFFLKPLISELHRNILQSYSYESDSVQ